MGNLLNSQVMLYVTLVMMCLGIFSQWIVNHSLKKMVNEADLMEESKHRLIRYIKLKYVSFYKIGIEPEDVDSLIKRCLYKYRIGPILLVNMQRVGGIFIGIGILFILLLTNMYRQQHIDPKIFEYTFWLTSMGLILLMMQYKVYAYDKKEQIFIDMMKDYLNNHLRHKLIHQQNDEKMNDELMHVEKEGTFQEHTEIINDQIAATKAKVPIKKDISDAEEEKFDMKSIEEILHQFFE